MRSALILLLVLGCQAKTPPPTQPEPTKAKESPPPKRSSLIPKMQGLNTNMEMLIKALKDADSTGAHEAARRVASLAQSIDPAQDQGPNYGANFAALVADLKQAAQAMPEAAKKGGDSAAKALRHLHDQCLRCHDQAPAAANVGVCQLTQ